MGVLIYGANGEEITFEDRLLAHLQLAIVAKLRRDERFAFSWDHGHESGGGRSTIWIHPAIPLRFSFSGSRAVSVNRVWLDELIAASNSSHGLRVMPEPEGVADINAKRVAG